MSHKTGDFLKIPVPTPIALSHESVLILMPNKALTILDHMNSSYILQMLKPNITSLGYALFLAISAAGVWGGVFPFLPMEFQTKNIVFWFYLSQSLACTVTYFASIIGVYELPRFTRSFLIKVASAPYFLGWCCLIAAIYIDKMALILVICGGALLGVGSVGFYMIWQRLFAAEDADSGNRDILVGTAYGAIFYYGLHLIPQAVTAFLIPLVFLPLFGLAAQIKSYDTDRNQPMFEDIPYEHPHIYKQVMKDHWRTALCIGAVGFCAGVMRSIAIADPAVGSLVNVLSMGCVFAAMMILIIGWMFKNIRLDIVGSYRVLFPFLITAFIAVPFLPESSIRWGAAILYGIYTVAIVLMMMHCAQVSRDRGINPIFVYAFFGAIVYTLQNIGFLGGIFAEDVRIIGLSPISVVALISVYALALMYFVGSGGLMAALVKAGRVESVELLAISRSDMFPFPKVTTDSRLTDSENGEYVEQIKYYALDIDDENKNASTDGSARMQTGLYDPSAADPDMSRASDPIASKSQMVKEAYRLSERETEVVELIAKGNSVARIAEMLVVSENTIRTHSKRIYAKLDIHKRQDLIDLINSF